MTTSAMTSARRGVYFGLPETDYHDDPALGSNDVKLLAREPEAFWHQSKFNPLWKPRKQTKAMIFGSATHKRVLEGEEEFKRLYAPRYLNGTTKDGKAEMAEIQIAGKIPLTEDEWNRIQMAGPLIERDPQLGNAFRGSCGHEVSIFWIGTNGTPMKCRIDGLKIKSSVDLKTRAPDDSKTFRINCIDAVSNYRYDVQAEHYRRGRLSIAEHIAAGRVYGDHDSDLLRRVAENDEFSWTFVFLQSDDAPLTYALTLSTGNHLYKVAAETVDHAEHNWIEFTSKYGEETAWLMEDRMEELTIDSMPAWFARNR